MDGNIVCTVNFAKALDLEGSHIYKDENNSNKKKRSHSQTDVFNNQT